MRSTYKQISARVLVAFGTIFLALYLSPSAVAQAAVPPAARVNSVTVTGGSAGLAVEISSSQSVALRSQVVTGPDRLILDFPEALPGSNLHNQAINRGQVKGIRVGLFSEHPPVTRVVIDLKSPQPYRIFPSGKTVIVKLSTSDKLAAAQPTGNAAASDSAHLNPVAYTPPPPPPPAPTLAVQFEGGRLSILAEKVSLAQVLNEVQRKIGADIPIPSMAAQEQVIVNTGLLPVRDALTSLLNGSRFNFIIVGADGDPSKVKSVILTFRGASGISQPAIASPPEPAVTDAQPEPEPQPQPDMQPQPDPQPQEGAGQQEAPAPQDPPPQ
ncbi:MAG TPA: AMIN domain-containing protein [Terriglobales bacterium]|nr:AMIN domain-containing protein [Terriglobales bacterium]